MASNLEETIRYLAQEIQGDVDALAQENDLPFEIDTLPLPPKDGKALAEFSITPYQQHINAIEEKINVYDDFLFETFKDLKISQQENQSKRAYKDISLLLKKGVATYQESDNFDSFWKRNAFLKNEVLPGIALSSQGVEELEQGMTSEEMVFEGFQLVYATDNYYPQLKKEISRSRCELRKLNNEVVEMKKTLNVVDRLQRQEYFTFTDEIEELLEDVLYGDKNLTGFFKTLKRKQQKKKTKTCHKKNSSTTTVDSSVQEIMLIEEQQVDEELINTLVSYGFTKRRANTVAYKKNSSYVKQFITSLDDYFTQAGFENKEKTKELRHLFSNNHILNSLSRNFGVEYLQAVNDLFSTYGSRETFPSGILPSFSKKKYADPQAIRSLIGQEEKNTVFFEGLERIKEKKHADLFIQQAQQHPYNTGRHIAKTSLNGDSLLHQACVKKAGHQGHFRRLGFGYNGRILFEVQRSNDASYKLSVFEYFSDHESYNKFFQK